MGSAMSRKRTNGDGLRAEGLFDCSSVRSFMIGTWAGRLLDGKIAELAGAKQFEFSKL